MNRITQTITTSVALAALSAGAAAGARAQDAVEPEQTTGAATTRDQQAAQEVAGNPFGIGFQSSWPAWGISGLYDVNERMTAQAIVGALGTLTTFGARGMYRFSQEESYNMYGYGTVGMWRYPGIIRENVVGFGGGAGIELDWRKILGGDEGSGSSFPPLFSSIDIGLVLANFEYYNFSGLSIGSGLHYRF